MTKKKSEPGGFGPNIFAMNSEELMTWIDDKIEPVLELVKAKQLLGPFKNIFTWAYRESPWALHFGIMCCALELAAAGGPRFDMERFGVIARSSPRQCDVLVVNGPVSQKFAPRLIRLYEQMPEPKWVVAMGECSISGGPFWESYSVIEGCDKIIPVDIYIPGCPVRPEALIDGFIKLRKKLREERDFKVHTK